MRLLFTSAALIFGLLGVGASPALAAKGVKKKPVNGAQHAHGVVTHVHHHPAKTSAGHIGEITIKTHHHKKKGQPAVAGKKLSHTHKYTVGQNTTFATVQGKKHQPASFAAVHVGEHVVISHNGNHANSVHIHKHVVKKAPKANKKTQTLKKKVK